MGQKTSINGVLEFVQNMGTKDKGYRGWKVYKRNVQALKNKDTFHTASNEAMVKVEGKRMYPWMLDQLTEMVTEKKIL